MPSENTVHIRLEYDEAIRAKRQMLFAEMFTLRIAKIIGRFRALRLVELGLKGRIYTRMKETKINLRKLQSLLPEPKRPRILKKVRTEEARIEAKQEYHSEDIESQLSEIQRKLDALQR